MAAVWYKCTLIPYTSRRVHGEAAVRGASLSWGEMADGPTDADLDDILNSALDDFEDDEIDEDRADRVAAEKNKEQMTQNMASLMDDLQNPEFQQTLEQTFKVLSKGSGDMPTLDTFMQVVFRLMTHQ